MKYEIKFRAKAVENLKDLNVEKDQWIYGYSLRQYESGNIEIDGIYCDSNTLGQFTCAKDDVDNEIYEGDILHIISDYCEPYNSEVMSWGNIRVEGETWTKIINVRDIFADGNYNKIEVIGNVYDNSNLLTDL